MFYLYPIVAVLKVREQFDFENPGANYGKFQFLEWACIRPLKN